MKWTTCAWTFAVCLWTIPTHAAVLDPLSFTSLGTLHASDSINTDTLQLTGGASYTGVLDPVSGASIFAFDDITGTSLSIFGTRTLGLLSEGNIAFTEKIDLLGSGGLNLAATGTMALANLQTRGNGEAVSLTANQINVGGMVDAGARPIVVANTTEAIGLLRVNNIVSGTAGISGPSGLVVTTGMGIAQHNVELGSGLISLTGETISGRVAVSTAGQIIGTSGVGLVAAVPLPAALPLYATGLGVLSLFLKRRRLSRTCGVVVSLRAPSSTSSA